MPNIMVDTCCIRPIALDGDEREPLSLDEVTRNALAHTIDLRRAVRCLPEKNDARITDPTQQRLEIGGSQILKPFTRCPDSLGYQLIRGVDRGTIWRREGLGP